MADGQDALLAALLGGAVQQRGYPDLDQFTNTLAANDLWKMAAAPVLGTKLNTSTWSNGETLAATAGQAFLGSLLKGLGDRSEAQQLAKTAAVLPQLYSNPSAVIVPEGVDAEAFGKLKLNALKEQALRGATSAKDKEESINRLALEVFARNPNLIPEDIGKKIGLKGEVAPEEPPAQRKQVLDEQKIIGDLQKSLDFIDSKFDQAKNLVGSKAGLTSMLGIPTDKGNELAGLGDSVIVQIDKVLGREMNSDVRQRMLSLAPKWYDSSEEIDSKAKALKELVAGLSPSTPLLGDRAVITTGASQPAAISRDQAIAELKRRGLIK